MLASDMVVEDSGLVSKLICWSPPSDGWVKLGVIRSEDNMWLGGFSVNKGEGSMVEAEV
ncbi:hypothetical protein ACOSQ3_004362 [Xanthoceras sorbifolium]